MIARDKETVSLEALKQKIPLLENIILINEKRQGFLSFEEILNNDEAIAPDIDIRDNDYSIIFYTSGTTGKPKGVLVSYKQLEAPAKHFN